MFQAASDQAFLLMLICLGACFVWAFREIEEARQRRQRHDAVAYEIRHSVKPSH